MTTEKRLWYKYVKIAYSRQLTEQAGRSHSFERGFFIALKKSNWPTTSRHERGYGNAWNKLRKVILQRDNGLCQCVECQGGTVRLTQANEVHHIKSKAKGGTDDPSNLQAVNADCHKKITAAEQGRTLKPKIRISESGWPEN